MSTDDIPRDFNSFRGLLAERRDELPRRLQQVAAFAVDHPDEVAFGTAASIARLAGVQPSTLVRFAKAIGYSGFSDLQGVFRNRLRDRWPDYEERLKTLNDTGDEQRDPMRLLFGFSESAMSSLERMRQTISAQDLERAVAALAEADTIYLLGQRRAYGVAAYLAYALPKLRLRAVLVDNVAQLGPEQLANAGPNDVVLAVSFTPYTPFTVDLSREAAERGVPVIAITDSVFSPLREQADIWFEIVETDFAAFRSISATFCLAMALAVAAGERRAKRGGAASPRRGRESARSKA
ncbi:MurR/RpiR family transcriptional regulator [Alsobacter sp. SYSU M60028]|uniref:MurR/RpiR family transcriptional regulator n=1 Tax=Alsobacter ponti TaxID=2962936 RepID=A0ABT1LBD0_9HYPH|nr:MurR/RpiR family transcriptional regulator [Alsobacter ponti]MCP8938791.1 MurR/RpiR family transcriptional regulator [Alsobacter ponti]